MATLIKKSFNENDAEHTAANNKVRSYANEPFFEKKNEEAKEIIKRVGLPKITKK